VTGVQRIAQHHVRHARDDFVKCQKLSHCCVSATERPEAHVADRFVADIFFLQIQLDVAQQIIEMPWPGEIVLKRLVGCNEQDCVLMRVVEFLFDDPRRAQEPDNDIRLLARREVIRHENFSLSNREALAGDIALFRRDHAPATRFGGGGGADADEDENG